MWGEFDRYPVGGVHTKESFSIIILIMESVEGVLVNRESNDSENYAKA